MAYTDRPTYVFIDGASLNAIWKQTVEHIAGRSLKFDYGELLRSVCAQKGFYYDAEPSRKQNQTEENFESALSLKRAELDRIEAVPSMHVRRGFTRGLGTRGRGQRQKAVDVHLAVEALTHSFRGNVRELILFADDLDFVPLVNALVDVGVYVRLFATRSSSRELRAAADEWVPLAPSLLFDYIDAWEQFDRPNRQSCAMLSNDALTRHGTIGPQAERLGHRNSGHLHAFYHGSTVVYHKDAGVLERLFTVEVGTISWDVASSDAANDTLGSTGP